LAFGHQSSRQTARCSRRCLHLPPTIQDQGSIFFSDRETWAWGTQCGTPNWCILLDKILFQHMPTKQYPRHASFSLMVSPSSRRFKKANRGT
jgi:hypothetical protein